MILMNLHFHADSLVCFALIEIVWVAVIVLLRWLYRRFSSQPEDEQMIKWTGYCGGILWFIMALVDIVPPLFGWTISLVSMQLIVFGIMWLCWTVVRIVKAL